MLLLHVVMWVIHLSILRMTFLFITMLVIAINNRVRNVPMQYIRQN
jgi:hypothetical protein